jgi:hypothetical protein
MSGSGVGVVLGSLADPEAATVFDPVRGGRALHDRSAEDDHRVAVHESGHAVCARLLGIELGGVTIEPTGEFGGMVFGLNFSERFADDTLDVSGLEFAAKMKPMMPRPGETRDDASAGILMHSTNRTVEIVAGSIAETMLLDGPPWPAPHDRVQEASFANLICTTPESAAAFIRLAEAQCRDLLEPHLHVVAELAAALRIERTMTGERVDEVIAAALAKVSVEEERARRAQWRAVEEGARRFEAMRECPLYSETDAIAARQRNDAIMHAAGAAAAP